MHFEGEMPFKMHKYVFFLQKTWKIQGFTGKFWLSPVTLNTCIFWGVGASLETMQAFG